ncbi:MAG TPA: S8 family serine peptidase [Thermoanaerobaculia bacterium]|nr:S8 family serine peptidase [Thermoanaerobaculia bacterium]
MASPSPLRALAAMVLAAGCATTAPLAPSPTSRLEPVPDFARQLVVTLHPGSERLWSMATTDLALRFGLETRYAWPLPSLGEQCLVYEVPGDRSPAEVARRLGTDRRVASAQPVNLFRTQAGPYNDPYSHLQHGLATLHLPQAHALATGRGVRVAVIDTGVDFDHPELAGRVRKANNFVSFGEPTFTGDVHGTAVAGVIAADANNREGIVGIAPEAEILALKACWPDATGSRGAACNTYTLAQAIESALAEGAQVLNLSLSGPEDPLLARLLAKALARGVVVVAAAPERPGEGDFPSSQAGVVAVRAAGLDGAIARQVGDASSHVGVAAPGVDILAPVPRGAYDFFSGSSLAAAQVSGVVALLLEKRPGLSSRELVELLRRTGRAVPPPGSAEAEVPLVDACEALVRLAGSGSCAPPP